MNYIDSMPLNVTEFGILIGLIIVLIWMYVAGE
jgi:hypothetical protein